MLGDQNMMLSQIVDNMTLTTRQHQMIYKTVGGTRSKKYKENSKSYFINLWSGLKSKFGCGE